MGKYCQLTPIRGIIRKSDKFKLHIVAMLPTFLPLNFFQSISFQFHTLTSNFSHSTKKAETHTQIHTQCVLHTFRFFKLPNNSLHFCYLQLFSKRRISIFGKNDVNTRFDERLSNLIIQQNLKQTDKVKAIKFEVLILNEEEKEQKMCLFWEYFTVRLYCEFVQYQTKIKSVGNEKSGFACSYFAIVRCKLYIIWNQLSKMMTMILLL